MNQERPQGAWSYTAGEYGSRVRVITRGPSGRCSVRWWDASVGAYRQNALGHNNRPRAMVEAAHIAANLKAATEAATLDASLDMRLAEGAERAREESQARLVIYVLRNTATGLIKIGISRDVPRRMRMLATQSGAEMELVSTIPGGYADEADLHVRFASDRLIGEWFHPSEVLLAWLEELRT